MAERLTKDKDTPEGQLPKGDLEPAASKPARKTPKIATSDLKALMGSINIGLTMLPATRDDVLADEEIDRMAEALDKAQGQSERLRHYLHLISAGSTWGAVIFAAVTIAIPRLERHGWLGGRPPADESVPEATGNVVQYATPPAMVAES